MNTFKKIIFTATASWSNSALLIVSNIATVPLILSKWSPEIFGIWLLIQAFRGTVGLPILAHQEYVFHENLKLGAKNIRKISEHIFSAIPFGVALSLLIIGLLFIDFNFSFFSNLFNIPNAFIKEWNLAIVFFAITALATSGVSGFFINALAVLGYYPLVAWANFLRSLFSTLVPVGFIFLFNINFFEACLILMLVDIIFFGFYYIVIFYILKSNKFFFTKFNYTIGFNQFSSSFLVLIRFIFQNVTSDGIRFLIVLLFNPIALVMFSTIRTISNVIRKGLESIYHSFVPETMNALAEKNFKKFNSAFELYFLFLLIFIYPGVTIAHFVAPSFFTFWTLGKIEFNESLFLLLNFSVLATSLSMPFLAILVANNLNKNILKIMTASLIFFAITIAASYKIIGILSVALALFVYELVMSMLIIYCALYFFRSVKIIFFTKFLFFFLLMLIYSMANIFFIVNKEFFSNFFIYEVVIAILYLLLVLYSYTFLSAFTKNWLKKIFYKIKL